MTSGSSSRLRDLKRADKEKREAEKAAARVNQKYPQKISSGSFVAQGDEALTSNPIQVKTTKTRYEEIETLADEQGISKAEWVRRAIDYYFDNVVYSNETEEKAELKH
jgi:hypothetical protein